MTRKFTLFFLAFMGLFFFSQAQFCGFDQKHQQLLQNDPVYAQTIQQTDAKLAAMMQSNANAFIISTPNGPVYQIPVVIHVIHTGGAIGSIYNPTDAQLTGMINYLNQAYAATWSSYPDPNNGGTFIPLQFVLAKRTPNCNNLFTGAPGIVRVDGSSVAGYVAGGIDNGSGTGADEATVKALSRWPNTEYYNVWVVNKIDGKDGTSGTFTAGYAYFPGAPATVDGTVMLATQATSGKITLVHEVGHAFNLYHTFEGDGGGSSCPPNTNCATQGDRVCDTDPHKRSVFNCPSATTNTCTGQPHGTVVRNFMDYSSCQDRFTSGQRTRVMNALVSSTSRSGLISSLGGTPISGPLPTACTPTITNPGNSANAGPRDIIISDGSLTYMYVTSSGYTNDGNQVYIDKTCKHMAELTAGNTYSFSVKTGFNPENVKVFIDYNNDGSFQTNEEIWSDPGTTTNQTHSFQFTVPTTATIPGLVSCVPLRMRVISDRTISPAITACGPLGYGQAEDYSVLIRGGGPSAGAVSVALTSGTNPSCFNDPLTFTAFPGTGITNPSYIWYLNGNNTGVTSSTYSSATFVNNDVVSVKVFYIGACGLDSALSTGYTINRQATVPAAVTIAVTGGNNPGCAGQTLTFTATPINGGSAPIYQWKVNGINVGTNSPTYSAILNNNDVVTVDMLSNSTCASPATAISNSITITHSTMIADISIAITAGNNPSCAGKAVTFTANTINAGTNPLFQWYLNNAPISGATNISYTSSGINNNDQIKAVLMPTDACVANASDTSNTIIVNIDSAKTPMVTVAITIGSNPGCLDSLIEFTATVTNHDINGNFQWLVNGTPSGSGLTFASSTLQNGDVVVFQSIALDGKCYTSDTITASPITMALFSTPTPPILSFIGNMLVANMSSNLVWYGPSGLLTGVTGQTYQPTQPGAYFVTANNGGCQSPVSNILTISLLDISTYDLDQVKIYPNPTNGKITLDWGNKNVRMSIDVHNMQGQGLLHEKVNSQNRKTIDLGNFANGNYFLVLRDETGEMGTVKILLNK